MSPRPSTRERIIETARGLFNAQGFAGATTASLAKALGMAEGNLWYHFKSKRSLLEAISEQFVERIDARLSIRPRADAWAVEEYQGFLAAFAAELEDFRFLYRDQADYGEHAPAILERLGEFYRRTQDQLMDFYLAMIEQGDLDWPAERLPSLVTNATIIIRFGLEFLRETGAEAPGSVARTFDQHLTLFEHRLSARAIARLKAPVAPVALGSV